MNTVTDKQIIADVATNTGLAQSDVAKVMKSFRQVVFDVVSEGTTIKLANFMTIEVKERAARAGRNPRTGETIQIAAKQAVTIKALKHLKDAAND